MWVCVLLCAWLAAEGVHTHFGTAVRISTQRPLCVQRPCVGCTDPGRIAVLRQAQDFGLCAYAAPPDVRTAASSFCVSVCLAWAFVDGNAAHTTAVSWRMHALFCLLC
jgi:hypothetical protein